MANASAKRIAAQNEKALQSLKLGMLLCNGLCLLIRLLFQKQSVLSLIVPCLLPLAWTGFICMFLFNSGSPKRDGQGTLISPGTDLNHSGLIEWSWDVLYITWFCQVGSSLLGGRVWLFYLIIPCYAGYKAWAMLSPLFFNRSAGGSELPVDEPKESRRQEKMRKRQGKTL